MHLIVVKLFKLHSLLVSHLSTILVLNFAPNQVIKSKYVPRIVCFRLDLTLCASLQACLCEIQTVLLVECQFTVFSVSVRGHRAAMRLVGMGSGCDTLSSSDWVTCVGNVHRSVSDG